VTRREKRNAGITIRATSGTHVKENIGFAFSAIALEHPIKFNGIFTSQ